MDWGAGVETGPIDVRGWGRERVVGVPEEGGCVCEVAGHTWSVVLTTGKGHAHQTCQ